MMDSYLTNDKIIYYLCRVRAKYAKQRSKKHLVHLLSNEPKLNHHKDVLTDDELFLKKILPPRRKWKKLGKEYRYKKDNRHQKINSIEYNTRSIFKTIKFYQKNHPNTSFVIKLNEFIEETKNCIDNPNYKIAKPKIYPKLKEKITFDPNEKNTCRPISLFLLRDKIIISQTNKYLSKIFDNEFYPLSHAFRAPIKGQELITHHDSIQEILNYKNRFQGSHLWVAECDMSKFYDSVNHSIILTQFNKLIQRAESSDKVIDSRAVKIFNEYLNSYNFIEDVLPKNKEEDFWKKFKIPNGEFGWVEDDLIRLNHYTEINCQRIGIPQGGALSGLIANLVLDYADSKVTQIKDDELLYIRFCDDMILMHPNQQVCFKAVKNYEEALIELKLVPHKFKCENELASTSKSFWQSKSKSPYKWSADYKKKLSFPWIGFVGYEVHFEGAIRVRKSSLKKEINKQKEVVRVINKAIQKDNKRARNGTIIESAMNRLNGMSVGRIQLWNHPMVEADMCWVNGFKKLNYNSVLKGQLRSLDKNKNHQIARLKKEVSKFKDPEPEEGIERPNRKLVYYGKPFSYHYQVLKKHKK